MPALLASSSSAPGRWRQKLRLPAPVHAQAVATGCVPVIVQDHVYAVGVKAAARGGTPLVHARCHTAHTVRVVPSLHVRVTYMLPRLHLSLRTARAVVLPG
jgi:hypothetical protein